MKIKFLKSKEWIITFSILIILIILFIQRASLQSSYVSSWDSVDFALGVLEFDLLQMQPHFPGYPYFIVGGMMINSFLNDSVLALITFNQILLITATIPIYLLAKKYVSSWRILLIVLAVQSLSFISVLSTQAMSEAGAIAVLWWFLWSIEFALKKKSFFIQLLPPLLFSILLGIRLSYLPFGIALLFLWVNDWKLNKSVLRILGQVVLAGFFQLIWITALAVSEGGFVPFIELSLAFTQGHFQEWGGTAASSELGVLARSIQLISINFFWNGLASRSFTLAIFIGILIIAVIVALISSRKKQGLNINFLLLVVFISYFLWALFAQNIEKPRHIAPLLGIFMLFCAGNLLQVTNSKLKRYYLALLLAIVLLQMSKGYEWMEIQSSDKPAVYQLATDANLINERDILFTWEETRVLYYLNTPYAHERVLTYNYFLQKKYNHKNGKVFLTNKVVEGFKAQGVNVDQYVKKVAEFSSSSFIDPVYHKIIIYEWQEGS